MGAVLLLASASSSAVTLGRLRGLAQLGRDLDVSVQVQFSADEDATAACFDADVSYGDVPVDRARISVSSQPSAQTSNLQVRIHAGARVDEALVHVNLHSTCGAKASRNYLLLSEVVSDMQAIPPASLAAPATLDMGVPVAGRTEAAEAAAKGVIPVARPDIAAAAALPHKAAPVRALAKAAAVVDKPQAKALVQAQQAALDELQHRVDGLAKLQANSVRPEDIEKNAGRATALEVDIRTLQQLMAKNQRNLQLVTTALESSESENFGRTLVYTLAALLLACMAALGYVLLRLRKGGADSLPWWSGGDTRPATGAPAAVLAPVTPSPVAAVRSVPPAPTRVAPRVAPRPADLDIELDHSESRDASPATIPLAVSKHPDIGAQVVRANPGAAAVTSHLKAINTKEMLDVRQQAEFFMALGRHDEAVGLLESSIEDSADANPLIFLDLLKILHTLSRRSDFERYRSEFNLQFTGRVPTYASFPMEGNGLEAYEDICQQIVVLWPTDYTVDYIEQCLVRTPEDDPEQGIDLEAFKDLLLLYGILKRLGQEVDSSLVPFSTTRTANSQLSALGPMPEDDAPVPALPEITGEGQAGELDLNLDLDLDLSLNMEEAPSKPDNLMDFDMSTYLVPPALGDK